MLVSGLTSCSPRDALGVPTLAAGGERRYIRWSMCLGLGVGGVGHWRPYSSMGLKWIRLHSKCVHGSDAACTERWRTLTTLHGQANPCKSNPVSPPLPWGFMAKLKLYIFNNSEPEGYNLHRNVATPAFKYDCVSEY